MKNRTEKKPKRKTDIFDERIVAESNKVYKTCFIALCIGIFVDTLFKFTMWYYYSPGAVVSKDGMFVSNGDTISFYVMWGIEALLLSAVFLLCLFSLARKGILLGSAGECKRFPFARYAVISLIAATAVFVTILLSRYLTTLPHDGIGEGGIWWGGVLLFLGIYAYIAVPVFVAFYLMFFVAYSVVRARLKRNEDAEKGLCG